MIATLPSWDRVVRPAAAPLAVGVGLFALAIVVALVKAPSLDRGLLGVLYFATLSFVAGADVQTRRASNRLVYPSLALAGLVSLALGPAAAVQALLGGVAAFLLLLAVAVAGRWAMGAGDVKVGALCGIVVGLHGVALMVAFAFVLGAVAAAVLLATGRRRRKDTIAFTPFLVLGTVASTAWLELYLWG